MINFASFVPLAGTSQVPEVLIFGGKCDATSGDPTVNAEDSAFEHQVINAGKNGVTIADEIANVGNAAGIAGAFFQSDEIFFDRQFREHFGSNVVRVTDRVVVDHDWQPSGFGGGPEMSYRFGRITAIEHCRQEHTAVYA